MFDGGPMLNLLRADAGVFVVGLVVTVDGKKEELPRRDAVQDQGEARTLWQAGGQYQGETGLHRTERPART
eukprot:5440278-Prymnesium_polylepis.2